MRPTEDTTKTNGILSNLDNPSTSYRWLLSLREDAHKKVYRVINHTLVYNRAIREYYQNYIHRPDTHSQPK